MKRRIIAALTALVMVVTMIPASAFAETSATADSVNALIKMAVDSNNKVSYDKKEFIEQAVKDFGTLSTDEAADVDQGKLNAAQAALNKYSQYVESFKEKMAEISTGSVTAQNFNTVVVPAINDYKYIDGLSVVSATDRKVTVTVAVPGETTKKALVGENNYNVMSGIKAKSVNFATLSNVTTVIGNINKIDAASYDSIEKITAANYNNFSFTAEKVAYTDYNTAKGSLSNGGDKFAPIAKGYDKYLAIDKKVKFYSELYTEIGKLTTTLATGDEVGKIEAMAVAADKTDYTDFVKALDSSKTVIEKNGEALTPYDFSNKAYKNFVAAYKLAKDNYDRYQTKASVIDAIRALPTEDMIKKADYATLVKYYDQYNAIDDEVAMTTVLAGTYTKVGTALRTAFASYENTIIEDYSKQLKSAIDALPTDITRDDIAKVDAIIDILVEYKDVTSQFTSKTETNGINVKKAMKLSEADDVFALSKIATITATSIKDTKLEAALIKLDANAWTKAYKTAERIKQIAGKDIEAMDAVVAIVAKDGAAVSALQPSRIKDKATAEAATKVIAEYEKAYNALNSYAKADFEAAVKDGNAKYTIAEKVITEAQKAIAKVADPEQVKKAVEARDNMIKLNNLDRKAIETTESVYNTALGYIAAVDEALKDDAVKNYVTVTYASVYKTYLDDKKFVEDLSFDGSAAAAVVKAIEELKEVSLVDVTMASVDASISSYESVEKMFNALSDTEKGKVGNIAKLYAVKATVKPAVEKVFVNEVNKIGLVDEKLSLTETQKTTINGITAMFDKYITYVNLKATNEPQNVKDALTKYNTAYNIMIKQEGNVAAKEYDAIKPTLNVAKAFWDGSKYLVNKTSAKAIISAVEAYNNLSEEAKEYALHSASPTIEADYHLNNLLASENLAKALVLDYATIEVADVDYAGVAAEPKVTVKDFNGKTVAETEYDVTYTNNEKPGTATVTVKAKAEGNYVGEVSKEFKVIAKELAKVENVKFDTDYGIVRVYFDRTADIDGIDVRYQVQYKKTTSDTWTTKYPTKGLGYLTLKNLTKNGKYDVRVRAYTDDYGTERVYGEYSDAQKVYANRNGAKSGIMYKAVIKSLTTKNGSVTMTVNPVKYQTVPQGVTWKYSYKKYGSQYKTWSTAKTTKSTSYTFKNLKKGTRYVFRAQYTYVTDVDKSTAVNSNYSVYKNIVVK